MFDRYMQPKRAFSGGFTDTFLIGTGGTTQTLIEVKRTTPLYEPMKHIIHVQKVTVIVTTAAAQTWTLRSATTHTNITPGMSMAVAGVKHEYDFGPQGIPLDINEDLQLLISAAGAAGTVVVEGFQERTSTALPAGFSLSASSGDRHATSHITITAAEGTFFPEGDMDLQVGDLEDIAVTWVSATSATVDFPPVAEADVDTYDITLHLADGQAIELADGWEYTVETYEITDVDADTGAAAGGETVTLTGYYFDTGVQVTFGGVAATAEAPAVGGLTMTCVTPAHVAGAVDVVFTNLDGTTATAVAGYTYA